MGLKVWEKQKTRTKCYWSKLVLSGTITVEKTTLIGEQTERSKPLLSSPNLPYSSNTPLWENLAGSHLAKESVVLGPKSSPRITKNKGG